MLIDSVVLAVFWALLFTDPFYADFGSYFQQLFLLCVVLSFFAAEDCWHFCWLKVFYLFLLKGALTIFCFLSASLLICPSFILCLVLLLTLLAFALLLSSCGLV